MSAPNPSPLLLDTDVLIDFLRKQVAARAFIVDAWAKRRPMFYSSVTVAELYAGIRPGENPALAGLLGSMVSVPLTDDIARTAGDYIREFRAQGVTLSIPDTIIAASAKMIGAELATLNTKHFPMTDISINKPYSRQ